MFRISITLACRKGFLCERASNRVVDRWAGYAGGEGEFLAGAHGDEWDTSNVTKIGLECLSVCVSLRQEYAETGRKDNRVGVERSLEHTSASDPNTGN